MRGPTAIAPGGANRYSVHGIAEDPQIAGPDAGASCIPTACSHENIRHWHQKHEAVRHTATRSSLRTECTVYILVYACSSQAAAPDMISKFIFYVNQPIA